MSRGSTITGRGFTNAALKDEVVSGADKVITSTSRSQEMLASAFTRLNYAYKNRYLFTFTRAPTVPRSSPRGIAGASFPRVP